MTYNFCCALAFCSVLRKLSTRSVTRVKSGKLYHENYRLNF